MSQSQIKAASAITDIIEPEGPAKTDISHRSRSTNRNNAKKNIFQNALEVCKVNDAISKQVHLDVPFPMLSTQQLKQLEQHPMQLEQHPKQLEQLRKHLEQPHMQIEQRPNQQPVLVQKHAIYQPIRLAQLYRLIGQPIFSHCDALLTPVATFGCVSVHGIVLQCALCSKSIALADVLARFTHSRSPRCTMELLTTLSKEHKAECRAMKVVDRLNDDDVQFGISEGNIDIEANILRFKGAQ